MARIFSASVLKQIVSAAAVTGILSGLLLTAVQQIQVVPLIRQAEVYEQTAAAASHSSHENPAGGREHAAWQPANGWERTLFTAIANIVLALGFALLLGAAISLCGKTIDWRAGLLWGIAGYVVFFVAPSLGLPPEVPGTAAAQLHDRQTWWLMTTVFTAAGLSLLVFAQTWSIKIMGAVLLGVPHLIGAPQPAIHRSAAPAELAIAFKYASAIANAVFWLSLGGLIGLFHKKTA